MDALLAAARAAAGPSEPVVVILPTAAARQRPEQAAAQGERAFRAAATRAGTGIAVLTAPILTRADAADPELVGMLAGAHLIHVPGGDPDLVPSVLRDTLAWAAILEGLDRGMCLAGASAGAMALGERVWTSRGGVDGLGLLPGVAVIPHFVAGRLDAWRPVVEAGRSWGAPVRPGRSPAGAASTSCRSARSSQRWSPVRGPRSPSADGPPRGRSGRLSSSGAAPDVRPRAMAARARRLVPQPRVLRGVPGAGP
jgi:hypothetical protein